MKVNRSTHANQHTYNRALESKLYILGIGLSHFLYYRDVQSFSIALKSYTATSSPYDGGTGAAASVPVPPPDCATGGKNKGR